MKQIFKFTLEDLKLARIIVSQPYEIDKDESGVFYNTDKPMWKQSFVTWANKVIRWWTRFYQVMRAYAKQMHDAALAVKAVWSNINKGLSLPFMLRQLLNPSGFVQEVKHYAKGVFSDLFNGQKCEIQSINPKSTWEKVSARNQRTAYKLQSL